MKPVIYAVSALLMLSVASSTALAYSGSECEVNDCSKPGPAKTSTTKAQPKTKAEIKNEAKDEAKTQGKAKLMDSAPSAVKDVGSFFK
jgi:hypothetical protein